MGVRVHPALVHVKLRKLACLDYGLALTCSVGVSCFATHPFLTLSLLLIAR